MTQHLHPVISVLKNRANKAFPFDDGRKVILVLPGGLMTSINGAGALVALEMLGLYRAFDSIYTGSAGFLNACYFLTKKTQRGATIYWDDLVANKFIQLTRFWDPIRPSVVVEAIKKSKPFPYQELWNTTTELHVQMRDMRVGKSCDLTLNDYTPQEFFEIAESSISFPYLWNGVPHHLRYSDGQTTGEATRKLFCSGIHSDATDVVIIYNNLNQVFLNQHLGNERVCEILPPRDSHISPIEMRPDILIKACTAMYKKVFSEFNE